ncbi:MAG: glycosyltransferase family 2 protein [Clostridia bacterium]|nr:glycosyltransferase family 2 protein [Clostridia bacterium]
MNFYTITAIVFVAILLVGILAYTYKFHFWKYGRRKQRVLPSAEQNKKYLILVPARDESNVIVGLLESIKNQTYNKENVETVVIVESKEDKTVEICKNYQNTSAYVLPYSPGSKSKALKIVVKDLYDSGKRFDGYFVIDADNEICPEFIELSHNAMCAGNDLVLGARVSKYPSGNWVSAGSTLTWTYINALNNKCRSENGKNIVVQGSPLLINKTIIEDFWHGEWPDMGFAEDLELGYICNIYGFKTFYYEYAWSYDVQPDTRDAGVKQRMRWVKGHHQANFKYMKTFTKTKCKYNDGIYKYDALYALVAPLIIIIDCLLFAIYSGVATIVLAANGNPLWVWALIGCAATFVGFYLIMCFWTLFAMVTDKEKLHMTVGQKINAFFTVPFFYFDYLPIYVKTLFAKNLKWERIDHKQNH